MAFRHFETSHHQLHQSRFLKRPAGTLWILRAVRLLKTLLKRLRPSRFFRCLGFRKWVRIVFRHLQTSLHRIHQRL
jgi:hypothetical protein